MSQDNCEHGIRLTIDCERCKAGRQVTERIIKLIDSQRDTGSHDAENDFINGLLDNLIALIERENK